jgi:tRNA-dihydrouridine synthase
MPSKTTLLLAPMLGITDLPFRSAFMETFGGFDRGISPFIRTLQGQRYTKAGVKELQAQHNATLEIHPQILTNQAADFIHLAKIFFDLGYPVVNLNMGCPVPTAAGRGRGAGLIPELDYVDRFLEEVLNAIPNKLSIKTRLGLDADDQLLKMVNVLNSYPLHEVIVHPRTAHQKYSGLVNHTAFHSVCEKLQHDIVYSGDIFTVGDFHSLQKIYPQINRWMLGRGVLQNPFLVFEMRGENSPPLRRVFEFYQRLATHYKKTKADDHVSLSRIKTLLFYLGSGFNFPKATIRKIRKIKSLPMLLDEVEHVVALSA